MEEKVDGAEERDEEFAEGSSEDADGVAEPTEEEVAGFMDDQIGVIEDEEAGAVGESVEKEEGVETEPDDSGDARDGLVDSRRALRDRRLPVALIYACPVCGGKHLERRSRVVLRTSKRKPVPDHARCSRMPPAVSA